MWPKTWIGSTILRLGSSESIIRVLTLFISVQSLSCVPLFATPWTAARQASLSLTNSWRLLKLDPLSQWCHPTISSSVVPFSSCLHSFPASGSFPVSQFFTSGGQSIGASASASVLPMNTQDWFPLGLIGWISLLSKGSSWIYSHNTVQEHQFFGAQLCYSPGFTSIYDPGKTIVLTRRTFVGKVMSLLFNMLSRLVITFLPRSKHLLISRLHSPSAVILEPPKIKPPQNEHCLQWCPIYLQWSDGTRYHDLGFLNVDF